MKKTISLFLVLSILLLQGNLLAKEKKGAELIIQKKDSQQFRGELIAVREKSLLLMERDSGVGAAVDIEDIFSISIIKKSKALEGFGLGLVIGVISGKLIGDRLERNEIYDMSLPRLRGVLFTSIGAATGGAIGGIIGAKAGKITTIQIEGKSDSEIQEILKSLRKKARIKNAS